MRLPARLLLTATLGMVAAAPAWSAPADTALALAVAGEHRDAKQVARDAWRHPAETLTFFGIRPDMTVVEVWPGGGWYTEILAPYLRQSGKLYVAGFAVESDKASDYQKRSHARLMDKFAALPEVYGRVEITAAGQPDSWTLAPPGSADLVLTFRNVHNWLAAGYDARMFQAFYDALKPGGTLGVVEHRAKPGTDLDAMKRSGYVTEAYVIQLAEAAGFKRADSSEINANPADDADHPEGVWTLPPSLRLGDKDREKYTAIGESDRMTLKFVKPAR